MIGDSMYSKAPKFILLRPVSPPYWGDGVRKATLHDNYEKLLEELTDDENDVTDVLIFDESAKEWEQHGV